MEGNSEFNKPNTVHEKYSFYLLYIMEIHVSTSYHKKEFICKQCCVVCCCYVIMFMEGKKASKSNFVMPRSVNFIKLFKLIVQLQIIM